MTSGKVYGCSRLQKFVSKKFWFLLNFENAQKRIIESAKFVCLLLFYIIQLKAGIQNLTLLWSKSNSISKATSLYKGDLLTNK